MDCKECARVRKTNFATLQLIAAGIAVSAAAATAAALVFATCAVFIAFFTIAAAVIVTTATINVADVIAATFVFIFIAFAVDHLSSTT